MKKTLIVIAGMTALALSAGSAFASKADQCDSYARNTANQQVNVAGNAVGTGVFAAVAGGLISKATGGSFGTGAAIGGTAGVVAGAAGSSAQWQGVYDNAFASCMNGGAQPAYVNGGFTPWSEDWYNYCKAKYKSFNPNTGNYYGYDDQFHFCQ